jgi:hypothetical protein
MAANAFGDSFSSGRSSKAGYGTSIQRDTLGTPTNTVAGNWNDSVEARRMRLEEERNAKKLETEGYSYPTNEEEREEKDFAKAVEDRVKAEEKAAAEKAAAEKAAAEKAKRDRDAAAKGEIQTGLLEAPPSPSPSVEAQTRSVNPAAPAATTTPDQLRARQDIANKLRSALGAEDGRDKDEMIAGLKAEAKNAGVADTAFDSFMERELARPTQGQLTARQDAANRLKAGIRSGDFNVISAAKEDAINAGVGYDLDRFIARQEEELARRGEITGRVGLEGKGSGLDEYYQTQTEKSRGVPLGFSSGRGRPIAPAHRIHTRLNRLVNRRTYEGAQDRSISPVAAAMRYEEALARQLAVDSPLDYFKMQRDREEKRRIALQGGAPEGTNLYGFGSR